VCIRPPQHTDAREGLQAEFARLRGYVARVVEVSRAEFERLVGDALDEIPEALARQMENVAVIVEDWPTDAQLNGARVSRGATLLGLYEGVPLTSRGPLSYSGVAPDRITIFQGPISRRAPDADALAAQVRVTVLHEVGHYFGMDDERLRALGWA
jgi:predicted Zn-dependent protease with MMP-like domain